MSDSGMDTIKSIDSIMNSVRLYGQAMHGREYVGAEKGLEWIQSEITGIASHNRELRETIQTLINIFDDEVHSQNLFIHCRHLIEPAK